jgi:Peptidase family M48
MINFLSQPFSSIYELYYFNKIRDSFIDNCRLDFFMSYPPVPSTVENKVSCFIQNELKLNPFSFRYVLEDTEVAAASGCIEPGKGVLFFSPDFCNEIENDFRNRHKFIIAHEIGHLQKKDPCEGRAKKERVACLISLGAYSVTVSVSSIFFPLGTLSTHLLGCTVAKIASLYIKNKIQQGFETEADIYAAQESKEIAQGGIDAMRHYQSKNLELLKKLSEALKNEDPSYYRAFIKQCAQLKALVNFSKEGDNRFNTDHPSLSERIKKIQLYT